MADGVGRVRLQRTAACAQCLASTRRCHLSHYYPTLFRHSLHLPQLRPRLLNHRLIQCIRPGCLGDGRCLTWRMTRRYRGRIQRRVMQTRVGRKTMRPQRRTPILAVWRRILAPVALQALPLRKKLALASLRLRLGMMMRTNASFYLWARVSQMSLSPPSGLALCFGNLFWLSRGGERGAHRLPSQMSRGIYNVHLRPAASMHNPSSLSEDRRTCLRQQRTADCSPHIGPVGPGETGLYRPERPARGFCLLRGSEVRLPLPLESVMRWILIAVDCLIRLLGNLPTCTVY